jgi:hypothetical protein
MARPSPTQSISTFIVRFWRDRATGAENGGSRLLGRIEHIPSGQQRIFSDLEQMAAFIGDYVRDFVQDRDDSRT